MKNKCKFLFILTFAIVFLFYKFDSVVAMANVQSGTEQDIEPTDGPEPKQDSELVAGTKTEQDVEPVAGTEVEQDIESVAGTESEQVTESVAESEVEQGAEPATGTELEQDIEPVAGVEPEQDIAPIVEAEPEQSIEPVTGAEPVQNISTGAALIEWLESHKDIGGAVKLADNVVLDEDYCFCPNGMNKSPVFVDTDKYTITVTGEIELLSDNHLTFLGEPDDKSIFYVTENGMLSMLGIVVESGQCALWQEEGAGLVIDDCHISGSVHYAETPFVVDMNSACVVVEKGQTVNDVLPEGVTCTVNRQGQVSHGELVPLSWNLEGTKAQQEKRQRFQIQGSFLDVASAEPALCTVAYNDYPLTFTDVKASVSGEWYLFRGSYIKPEEYLPITVMPEYSFDGEHWIACEEENVTDINASFLIIFNSEQYDTAVYPNIYIRLHWDNNGTGFYSNVLCYAADNLEYAEDIGGGRGGGTSITNPPDNPQQSGGDVSSKDEEPDQNANQNTNSGNDESAGSSDTDQTRNEDGDSGADEKSGGQPLNAEALNADAGQPMYTESPNANEDKPLYAEPVNTGRESYADSRTDNGVTISNDSDNKESINHNDSGASEKEKNAVSVLSVYGENGTDSPTINKQTLRSGVREGNAIFIATGFVLLSAVAGVVVFYAHSRSGTNR